MSDSKLPPRFNPLTFSLELVLISSVSKRRMSPFPVVVLLCISVEATNL